MPPFRKDWAHTLLYAMVVNLGPPSAEDKLQWQEIAGFLPGQPWGDAAFELCGKVQTRAQREGWLKGTADDQEVREDSEEEAERAEDGAEAKKKAVNTAKRKSAREGEGKKNVKRPRAVKDVDGEESSEGEVVVVENGKKVIGRRMARLRRGGSTMVTMTSKSEKAALKGKMNPASEPDSGSNSNRNVREKKAITDGKVTKSGGKIRTKREAAVIQAMELPSEFLDDED
ncbi:hypothetical protein N431DRAFT_481794 [Stipitochalara longipes BDJ]|nr:hypothetical protein N431DRAFT_481794 [Stipitochalara longipes BDJ]